MVPAVQAAVALSNVHPLKKLDPCSVGFRAFYAFIPLVGNLKLQHICTYIASLAEFCLWHAECRAPLCLQLLWLFGPTALLCSTVLEVMLPHFNILQYHS